MISKWRLTASADEVIGHRDLGIIRRDALSLQSMFDAFIPLRGGKEKYDLLLFSTSQKHNATKLRLKLQTHIIPQFSVDVLLMHYTDFFGQEGKFFKIGGQQSFLCTLKKREESG